MRTRHLRILCGVIPAIAGAMVGAVGLGVGGHSSTQSKPIVPLAARGPVSAALGHNDPAYRIRGLSALNPAQGFQAKFSDSGPTVIAGQSRTSLHLSALGRGDALRPLGNALPRVADNRIEYAHAGVREWYANGPLGLEQGFEVGAPPLASTGPLALALTASGDTAPKLVDGAVLLGDHLRYGGLVVTDARGRSLRSWLGTRRDTVTINVDDRGAAYPLHIDPFIQQAKLTASDGAKDDELGTSIAISGDTIAVGAPLHANKGAVYVFTKPASGWANAQEVAELTASDGGTGDLFGQSVGVDGDTIVAGALGHLVAGKAGQGAAYVFVKPASGWANAHETAELTASDGAASDFLGSSVAISGNTIVAGAPGFSGNEGALYVFTGSGATWTQQAELTQKTPVADNRLGGDSLAISGNTIVTGTVFPVPGKFNGAAFVFAMPSTGWADGHETAQLTASNNAKNDEFGSSVAISGNTIAIGAEGHDCGHGMAQGAAYVYTMPASGWTDASQTAELCAPDGVAGDTLGTSVAVMGTNVLAGAPLHTVGTSNMDQGAVYQFTMPPSGWSNVAPSAEFSSSDGATFDEFGTSVAASGTTLAVGALQEKVGPGAAYVFGAVAPSVSITSPADGATYTPGEVVDSAYSCTAPTPATITSCSGTVANGTAIDTSTRGTHSFTVTATDSDGASASRTVTYTVGLAPSISGFKQSARRWREANRSARLARASRPPVGTKFTFTLNEAATVELTFKQRLRGRKVGHRCVAPNAHTKSKPTCKRTVVAGTVTLSAHQGTNQLSFYGRLSSGRKLRPGRYTVMITATSANQTTSAQPLTFTIVR